MAVSSMKDIKLRIKSVESTMQITKAMEMVASSKLRRAKERAEHARPYFNALHETLHDIAYGNTDFSSPYVQMREIKKTCYVMIAGDRGLAGGYNTNVFKTVTAHMADKSVCVLPIGKKAVEYCLRHGYEMVSDAYVTAEDVGIGDCFAVAQLLCNLYTERKFDALYMGYTNFVSMLSQQPAILKVLPIRYERKQAKNSPEALIMYEPSCESVFNGIVPEYVGGLLYGALAESVASELGARRTAMDSASKNANDMIEHLSLQYNRARQGSITQEITEIVAGASL
ncbi:MAG: ATP synthase F1 subunit gamma [Ruthenibacterium sp.]